MNELIQLDQHVFHFINGTLHNDFLDAIMPYWRDKKTWIPLYLALAAFVIYKFRLKGLYFVLAIGATVGIADTISSKLIKPTVQRLRPCNDIDFRETVDLLIHCGSGYSFTSSHATNHFAVAAFIVMTLGAVYPKMRWFWWVWAASIALGQVYVGVHYPLDILAGAIIGTIIGNIVAKVYLRVPQFNFVPQA